jgi:hypothetical protein
MVKDMEQIPEKRGKNQKALLTIVYALCLLMSTDSLNGDTEGRLMWREEGKRTFESTSLKVNGKHQKGEKKKRNKVRNLFQTAHLEPPHHGSY